MGERRRSSRGTGSVRYFRSRLLAWYGRHARPLPWRRTRNPYAILVSEVMLQQTPVGRVRPAYARFLQRYPTLESLAAADASEVREAWEGLGYYARARNLHAAARQIVEEWDGRFPRVLSDLVAMPGVGRSTAGAVLSFAFLQDHPILDTNVARVLQRFFVVRGKRGRGAVARRLWELSAAVLPRGRAHVFNQALMDLGATVCLARRPRCPRCPLRRRCPSASRFVSA